MTNSFNLSRTSLVGAAFLGTCGLYFISKTVYNSFFAEKPVKQEGLVKQFSDLKSSFEGIKKDYLTKDKVTVEDLSKACSETQVVLSPLLSSLRDLSQRVNKLYQDSLGTRVVYADSQLDEAFPYTVSGLLGEANQLLSICQKPGIAKFASTVERITSRFASLQACLSDAQLEEKPALLKAAEKLNEEIKAFQTELSTDPLTREPSTDLSKVIFATYTMVYQSEEMLNEIHYAIDTISSLEKYKTHSPISVYYSKCQGGDTEHIREYLKRTTGVEQAPIAPFSMGLEVYIRGEELADIPSDGNCLFHSLWTYMISNGHITEEDEIPDSFSFRQRLAGYMRDKWTSTLKPKTEIERSRSSLFNDLIVAYESIKEQRKARLAEAVESYSAIVTQEQEEIRSSALITLSASVVDDGPLELPTPAHQEALEKAIKALEDFDAENPEELSVDDKIEKAISFLSEKSQWGGDEIIRAFMAWAYEVKGLKLSVAVLGTDEADAFVKKSSFKKEVSPQVGEEHLFRVLMTHDYLDQAIIGLDEAVCVREEGVADIVLWNQNRTHFHLFTEPVARLNQDGDSPEKTIS